MWIVHHPNLRAKATHTPSPNAAHGAHQSQGTSTMRHQAVPPTTRQLTDPLLVVAVLYEIEHDDRVPELVHMKMAPPRCIHIHPFHSHRPPTTPQPQSSSCARAKQRRDVSLATSRILGYGSRDTEKLRTHKTKKLHLQPAAASRSTIGGTSHGEAH